MFPRPRSILFEGIVRRGQKGGQGLGAKVRDLTIIALVSLFSLGLAWAYEADLFASRKGFTVEKNFPWAVIGRAGTAIFRRPCKGGKRGPGGAPFSRLPSRVSGRSHRRASVKSRPADGPSDNEKSGGAQRDFLGRNRAQTLGRNSRAKI
jgi:hypothetical protein